MENDFVVHDEPLHLYNYFLQMNTVNNTVES